MLRNFFGAALDLWEQFRGLLIVNERGGTHRVNDVGERVTRGSGQLIPNYSISRTYAHCVLFGFVDFQ